MREVSWLGNKRIAAGVHLSPLRATVDNELIDLGLRTLEIDEVSAEFNHVRPTVLLQHPCSLSRGYAGRHV
jgi:hypothetical protein